jgi:hypothetical protein
MKVSILALQDYLDEVRRKPYLEPYATQLQLLLERIETAAADKVLWAAAFGSFLQATEPKTTRSSSRRMEILVVSTITSAFKAHMLLGEKVFGPVLLETDIFPDYHILTRREFETALEQKNELVRQALANCVTVYGVPLTNSAVA